MEDIDAQIKQLMEDVYREPRPEYEGYSGKELDDMEDHPFGEECRVRLNTLSSEEYLEIPIVSQVKYFLEMIAQRGPIKLTQKGRLPIKVVTELYNQGFIKYYYVEQGYVRVFQEGNITPAVFTRIITTKAGLVKKRGNKLSLTAKALKVLDNNELLFKTILEAFYGKYTWTEMDVYQDRAIGRYGFVFSLALLGKYGHQTNSEEFYADKYFRAFPELLLEPRDPEWVLRGTYIYRTFEIFMTYFGVAEIKRQPPLKPDLIQATPLFSKLFTVLPPSKD